MPFKEATTQLMRHNQVKENIDQAKGIEFTLKQPPHVLQGVDVGALGKQLRGLRKMIDTQSPTSYKDDKKDEARKRQKYLEEQIVRGMCTSEEMRKNPPGAVGKHQRWEKKQKKHILEWKNIKLRLNVGDSDPDLANVERLRPTGSSMNMHNAQITGQEFHMPDMPHSVVITDEEKTLLQAVDPELAGELALMNPEQRLQLKGILANLRNKDQETTLTTEDDPQKLARRTCATQGCKRASLTDENPWHCWQHEKKDE